MKKYQIITMACLLLTVAACHKKPAEPTTEASTTSASSVSAKPTETTSTEPMPAPAKTPEEMTDAERELAKKQALMDFATMEDTYINDPKAQWATAARASSTFGDDNGKTPSSSRVADNVVGKVDGESWTNNHQDIGFDWLEVDFAKPVAATEVRLVVPNGEGVEAISKVELQDTDGKWVTVWSGISDVKPDARGSRTWFVRSFAKTAFLVKTVKFTIANNLYTNYKLVDAAQLIGE